LPDGQKEFAMNPFLVIFLVLLVAAVIAKLVAAAILLLLVAGLIFRTKETVGLLLLLAIMAGFNAYPLIGTGIVGGLLALSLFAKHREKKRKGVVLLPGPDD
jgi:hypothetical protein